MRSAHLYVSRHMADTRATPVSFFRAVRLCLLLIFVPARFIEAEEEDSRSRANYTGHSAQTHRAYIVRRAFAVSFLLVLTFGVFGYISGVLLGSARGCAASSTISWLQLAGACLLLWGTLFVRGWEIQSYSGVQFTERVNQWLYRSLYCVGTAVVVCSLAWPQCTK